MLFIIYKNLLHLQTSTFFVVVYTYQHVETGHKKQLC